MQFYKGIGNIDEQDSKKLNDLSDLTVDIGMHCNIFSQKRRDKNYLFVNNISKGMVYFGIISQELTSLEKDMKAFFGMLEMKLSNITITEVTLDEFVSLLKKSQSKSYINDDDEVLDHFQLDTLVRRYRYNLGFYYSEKIIEELDEKTIRKEANKLLSMSMLNQEIDRIFMKRNTKNILGHPVHYFIETDDLVLRKQVHKLLIQSLYLNGRIHNKRYSYVDIEKTESFSAKGFDCLYKSSIGGTVIVRINANDCGKDDYATEFVNTIEKICETMLNYYNQVLTIFCIPRTCSKVKEKFYDFLGETNFVELKEHNINIENSIRFLKQLCKDNNVTCDKKLISKLDINEEYLEKDLKKIYDIWFKEKLKTNIYPQYKEISFIKKETNEIKNVGSAYDELMSMIGIDEAKKVINTILKYNKARKVFDIDVAQNNAFSRHMIFTGNPGTAKTTVARLFAKIMRENEILSKGKLIEVGRGDLVGKYVGWTAKIVQKKFEEAKGSVLFIDEAYSLVDDKEGLYGDEAINTIVQEMENHREDVVVIFAGYPDKMEKFLNKNPGLRSRIAYYVNFADYNPDELCSIMKLMLKKDKMKLSNEANTKLKDIFSIAVNNKDFGNGRYVRNILEKAKMAQLTRLLDQDNNKMTKEEIHTILPDDIEYPQFINNPIKKAVGF